MGSADVEPMNDGRLSGPGPDGADVLVPPRSQMPRWLVCIGPAVILATIVAAVVTRRWEFLIYSAVWTLTLGARWVVPTVQVSRTGVRLAAPRFRQRRLPWSDVAAVVRPSRFDTSTTLLLTDGRFVTLAGIDADQAARVAGLGGKPLTTRPDQHGPGRTSATVRHPTEAERESALARRAADLEADRRRLQAALDEHRWPE